MEKTKASLATLAGGAIVAACLFSVPAEAGNDKQAKRAAVIDHWNAERRAAAQPRDMVIDHRGLGYLRRADGSLRPHGHTIEATGTARPSPQAKPGGGGNDTTPPAISSLNPAEGEEIGDAHTFSAVVTDESGIRSVTFIVTKDGGSPQSFSASNSGNNVWTISLSGFTDGSWSWTVEAKDTAKRGGNTATETASFTVATGGGGGGGGGGGDIIENAVWTSGGAVKTAVGRLFYEMPSNQRRKRWNGYVCSGTVVTDGIGGRSIILTASHCVYDDANKAFARNVLFIPDQANTSGSGTDSNCGNDPLGCWVADFGVVDTNWTTRTFPDNIPWDYAFYVVDDAGAHQQGLDTTAPDALDAATGSMMIDFTTPAVDDGNPGSGSADYTFGMGYSYSDDPFFMYCAEDMTTEGTANWWLPSCGLSGGSSGGPWLQPPQGGSGDIISVNSWGYTGSPGMAGPKLHDTSAQCVFDAAILNSFPENPADGDAGYAEGC